MKNIAIPDKVAEYLEKMGYKELIDDAVTKIMCDGDFTVIDQVARTVYEMAGKPDGKEYLDAIKERIAGQMDNYREFMS